MMYSNGYALDWSRVLSGEGRVRGAASGAGSPRDSGGVPGCGESCGCGGSCGGGCDCGEGAREVEAVDREPDPITRSRFLEISRARSFGDRLLGEILESRDVMTQLGPPTAWTATMAASWRSRSSTKGGSSGAPGRRGDIGEVENCCESDTVTVGRGDYARLRDRCTIYLGTMLGLARVGSPVDLESSVGGCLASRSTDEQMFQDYLPDWFSSMSGMRPSDLSSFKVGRPERSYGGLFWGTYYQSATQLALCTLYGAADCVDLLDGAFSTPCQSSARVVRDTIERRSFRVDLDPNLEVLPGWCRDADLEISVDGSGQVRASRDVRGTAWALTPASVVHLCNTYEIHAMLADYYFFWASRLHALSQRTGSRWDYFMGMLCARCALTEIVELSAVICHELHHITSGPFHCHSIFGRERFNCCHFGLEHLFRNFMWAEHGLPQPHLVSVARTESQTYRGDATQRFAAKGAWTQDLIAGGSCAGMVLSGDHDSLLDLRHRVALSWTIPEDCLSGRSTAGSGVLND